MLPQGRRLPELTDMATVAAKEGQWWNSETVAVVTGANRGIGLEIARQLAGEGITVVMTARKPQAELSASAQEFLQQEGRKNIIFHTLDIDQPESISEFVCWLKLTTGFIDILINNAGVSNNHVQGDFMQENNLDSPTVIERYLRTHQPLGDGSSEDGGIRWIDAVKETYESATRVTRTNWYGTMNLTKAVLPLLRPSSHKPRIVNVSSLLGLLRFLRDEKLKKELSDVENLTEKKIEDMLEMFLEDVRSGKDLISSRWPVKVPAYSLSKVAVNAYTRFLARELAGKACVNSVHPGYVKSDMTLGTGDIPPSRGASNVVRVALFPAGGPSGHNFLENEDSGF